MNNILWYQTLEDESNDVISFNGEIILPPPNPLYIEKYEYLYNIDKQVRNEKTTNNSISKIYRLPNGFFMKGYFEEIDNHGRKIAFMFYSNTIDSNEFIKRLKKEAFNCNKTCSDSLINEIIKFKFNPLPLKTLIMVGLAILFLIILLASLMKNK